MAKRKKGGPDSLSTEEKIKAAARKVFLRKGFSATRTRDIAEEAGINLALLNYYYRSKEKLFDIVMMDNFRQFIRGISINLTDGSTPLPEKVRTIATAYIDFLIGNPDLPLFSIRTLDAALAQGRWGYQVFGTMFAVFALIALALSAVGLYAVTAYSVSQRTQEIGVRMALGARPQQVWWLVLRGAIGQLTIGLALGIGGAIGVGRLLNSLLVEGGSRDGATLASIVALLVFVSLAACFLPARRATRLDPMNALRYE